MDNAQADRPSADFMKLIQAMIPGATEMEILERYREGIDGDDFYFWALEDELVEASELGPTLNPVITDKGRDEIAKLVGVLVRYEGLTRTGGAAERAYRRGVQQALAFVDWWRDAGKDAEFFGRTRMLASSMRLGGKRHPFYLDEMARAAASREPVSYLPE